MVVVVAVVLALASYLLKDRQQRNIAIETKQMILKTVHLGGDADNVKDKATYIEQEYSKYITDSSITEDGKVLPLYICKLDSQEKFSIIPVKGTGLWGPIWGYIALKSDFNTIYGAIFNHKSETPGLGAEIATPNFSGQFSDKQIFDEGNFVSILVMKGGAEKGNVHQVDAISGGTITSKAVEEMLKSSIGEYLNYFKANLNKVIENQISDSTLVNPADSTQLINQIDTTKN
jgi:Na+-transporting NADH:ubiquinone oxidoreductase subunit C